MSQRWKPNVTVAAVIAGQIDGCTRYLLVEEHTPEGLMFNNPAGHLDPEESPQQGVVSEALEETTRVFTPDCLIGVYMARFQRLLPAAAGSSAADEIQDVTYLRFAFGGSVGDADPRRSLDDGIVRTVWMSLDEVRVEPATPPQRAGAANASRTMQPASALPLDLVSVDASLYSPEIKVPR